MCDADSGERVAAKTNAKRLKGKIKRIAFTVYTVGDMSRARRFYEKALGLTLTNNFKDRWIEYHLGNGCFAITTEGDGAAPSANSGQIAFEVDDVDAVVNRLRAHGATVKVEPASGTVCRMAEVIDSEGNVLTIHAKHDEHSARNVTS